MPGNTSRSADFGRIRSRSANEMETYKELTEQQLCLWSRIYGGPWSVVPDHCVEDGEELAHASGESQLPSFPCREQPERESAESLVVCDGGNGRHVKGSSHARSAASNAPRPAPWSAVSVVGGKASQGRNLLTIELPKLGEMRQKLCRSRRADAGH